MLLIQELLRLPGTLEASRWVGCGMATEYRVSLGTSEAIQMAQENPASDSPSLRLSLLISLVEGLE